MCVLVFEWTVKEWRKRRAPHLASAEGSKSNSWSFQVRWTFREVTPRTSLIGRFCTLLYCRSVLEVWSCNNVFSPPIYHRWSQLNTLMKREISRLRREAAAVVCRPEKRSCLTTRLVSLSPFAFAFSPAFSLSQSLSQSFSLTHLIRVLGALWLRCIVPLHTHTLSSDTQLVKTHYDLILLTADSFPHTLSVIARLLVQSFSPIFSSALLHPLSNQREHSKCAPIAIFLRRWPTF